MSERTRCNHCDLELIKDQYGADKVHVHRLSHAEMGARFGPPPEKAPAFETRTYYEVAVDGEAEPVAYFMELTVDCCC